MFLLNHVHLFLPQMLRGRSKKILERWNSSNNKAKAYILASMSDALRTKLENKETAVEILNTFQEMIGMQNEQV